MKKPLAAFTMDDMEYLELAQFARTKGSKDKTRRRKRTIADNILGTTTAGRIARGVGAAATIGAAAYGAKNLGQIKGLAKSAYKKVTTRKPKSAFRQKEAFGPVDTRTGPFDTRTPTSNQSTASTPNSGKKPKVNTGFGSYGYFK